MPIRTDPSVDRLARNYLPFCSQRVGLSPDDVLGRIGLLPMIEEVSEYKDEVTS